MIKEGKESYPFVTCQCHSLQPCSHCDQQTHPFHDHHSDLSSGSTEPRMPSTHCSLFWLRAGGSETADARARPIAIVGDSNNSAQIEHDLQMLLPSLDSQFTLLCVLKHHSQLGQCILRRWVPIDGDYNVSCMETRL